VLAGQQAREEELRRRVERLEDSYQEAVEALARYRELFEFAPDCYLVTDFAGVIREANQAAAALLVTPRQFLPGKPLLIYLAREAWPEFYRRLSLLKGPGGGVQEWEADLYLPHGEYLYAVVTAVAVADAGGAAVGVRWLVRDITARRRAEEALRAEKEFVEALLDTAPALVLVLDPAGRVLRANHHLKAVSGFYPGELAGDDGLGRLFPGAELAGAREEFARALAGGRTAHAVCPIRTRDGRLRTVEWSGRALSGFGGVTTAFLVVGHDITELQEAQQRAVMLERLAAIGQMAAGLAHESRNALQRGQACLDMLRWRLKDRPEALDLVGRAQKAQDDLLRLYEDVRSYAAPIRLECRPCNLAEVWREAWAELTALFPGRDARLEEEAGGLDLTCEADPFRLAQVFRNVLDNSLAACPDPVRVRVSCSATQLGGRPALWVAVSDNGPGLTAEQRQRLFDPFYTTKIRGTGLGLAIAKRVVEAHGGQIAVGEPTPGATILITLPRRQP
jgi:PAS domain S-box-containing protein